MTQRERDRLVALNKADKKLITQKQAAQQIGLSERQVRRLLAKLRSQGDRAVIHAARGRASNRKISACQRQVEMSYSLPSRNVRLRPAGWRGGGRVVAVGGRVAPVLRARGRSDGAGSEASG